MANASTSIAFASRVARFLAPRFLLRDPLLHHHERKAGCVRWLSARGRRCYGDGVGDIGRRAAASCSASSACRAARTAPSGYRQQGQGSDTERDTHERRLTGNAITKMRVRAGGCCLPSHRFRFGGMDLWQ